MKSRDSDKYTIEYHWPEYYLLKREKFLWWYYWSRISSSPYLEDMEHEFKIKTNETK